MERICEIKNTELKRIILIKLCRNMYSYLEIKMKKISLVFLPILITMFSFSCEDGEDSVEVFEEDRLYGLWFKDSSTQVIDGDSILIFNNINDEQWGYYWVSYSQNEKKSYFKTIHVNDTLEIDCYNLVTRSVTWEKIDDRNFKNVELREDGSTIEYYFYFKNDYDGMYMGSENSPYFGTDRTYFGSHLTKIEDRTFEPLCP
mgnify:CR=1 FL=1